MPIARVIPETIVGETPHIAAIVLWVRLVPVSSRSIEVLVSGNSLGGMSHPYRWDGEAKDNSKRCRRLGRFLGCGISFVGGVEKFLLT
jgi:hypothetical protein